MIITGNDYEEVYEVLSCMDKKTVMQIPNDILKNIKEKRNKNFQTNIDVNDLFNFNNVSNNTKRVLAWLDVNYLIDKEKKIQLENELYEKCKSLEKYKKEKYSVDSIFKEKKEKIETRLIEHNNISFIEKINRKIKDFINMFIK